MPMRHFIALVITYLPYAVFVVCLYWVWQSKRTGRHWSPAVLRRQRLIALGLVSVSLALSVTVVILSSGATRTQFEVDTGLVALVLALLLYQLLMRKPST